MKWFGRGSDIPVLGTLLANYSPYEAPHSGNHLKLTTAQASENLEYLQANKEHRLDALQALIKHYDIDLKPALAGDNHKPVIEDLYRWAQREWAPSAPTLTASRTVWRTTNRQADDIIYSVVMDCAILLGEVVIHRQSAFAWVVDLDPINLHGQMPSAHRVVLQAPSLLHPGQVVIVDWEERAVAILLKPTSAANQAINLWQRICSEAIGGAIFGQSR